MEPGTHSMRLPGPLLCTAEEAVRGLIALARIPELVWDRQSRDQTWGPLSPEPTTSSELAARTLPGLGRTTGQ